MSAYKAQLLIDLTASQTTEGYYLMAFNYTEDDGTTVATPNFANEDTLTFELYCKTNGATNAFDSDFQIQFEPADTSNPPSITSPLTGYTSNASHDIESQTDLNNVTSPSTVPSSFSIGGQDYYLYASKQFSLTGPTSGLDEHRSTYQVTVDGKLFKKDPEMDIGPHIV